MPKSILDSILKADGTKKYDWTHINSIKNFQLLDYGTNRGAKNASPFAAWVNDSNCVKDKAAYIDIHLIPADETLWTEDRFEGFIEARAKLILQRLNESAK